MKMFFGHSTITQLLIIQIEKQYFDGISSEKRLLQHYFLEECIVFSVPVFAFSFPLIVSRDNLITDLSSVRMQFIRNKIGKKNQEKSFRDISLVSGIVPENLG